MIAKFQAMVRNKTDTGLAMWIEAARQSLVASFANGVAKDAAAVRKAITLPWPNGQTEGQITKLKLVKRQMVWAGEDRFASSSADWRAGLKGCTKIASEPRKVPPEPGDRPIGGRLTPFTTKRVVMC
jgi:hypothetical protein